ncbi:hypothetical protein BGW38_010831 [Lunasporangiospora selenospora]|uniref:Uncharacterized protein n=1 Tax=Lunasporangiospora selenospora TaxID=979761 RepID=A0A9P6FWI6_9FUNG|nr:hypothetical protein BGW38_010831 [Lunasporangiospora selenospora]
MTLETPHLLSTVLVSGDLVAGSGVGAKQDALQSTLITDTSHVSETTLSPRHHLREPIGLGFPSTLRKSFFEDYNYRSPLWQYRSRQQTSRRRRSNETAMIFGHSRTAQAGSVGRTPRMDLMSHVQRSQLYAPVSLSSITKHQRSDPISGSLEKERHSSPQEIIPVSKLIEQAAEISSFCHHVASGELGPASPTFGFCSTNTPRPSSMSALITGDYNYKKRPSSFASKPPTTPTSALFFAPRTNRKSRPGGLTNSLRDDTTISSPLASPGAAFLRQTDIPASQKSPILWSRPMQYLKRKSEALQHFVNQQPSTTPPPDQMAAQKGSTRGCRTVPITAGSFHSKANSNTPMSISLPIVSLEEREKLIRVITEDYSQDSSQVCPPVQTNIYSNAIDDLDDPWFTPKKDPFTTERGMVLVRHLQEQLAAPTDQHL